MHVRLILVPYDSGHRGLRLGAGPERLAGPITDRLAALGHEVHSTVVEPRPTSWRAEDHVWLVGARDIDPAETVALDGSGVRRVPASVVSPALATTIGRQARSITRFALHVDLDVLDAGEGRANSYAVGGGVSSKALTATCSACARDLGVEALTLSAYDPACDVDGRVIDAAVGVAEGVLTESAASYRDRDRIITSSSPPGSTS